MYQTLYNPYTRQTKQIDLSLPDAHQQIASLYQQGWTASAAVQATSISSPSPTKWPTLSPAEQEAVFARMSREQSVQAASILDQEQANNRASGQTSVESEAEKQAIPQEIYDRLGPGAQKHFRIAPKVSSEVYSKLGPGTRKAVEEKEKSTFERVHEMAEGAVPIYGTIKYWNQMPTWAKVLSIAGDVTTVIPAIAITARLARPVSVIVPTVKGDVTVWKGIAPGGKPIFGISKGELTLGTKGVKYPELTKITAGYEPVTKIETSIMATTKALKKMGVSKTEINKLKVTLSERGAFAGKTSPYLTKTAPLPTVERLTQDEVSTIFQVTNTYGKKVDKVFGTVSLEPQLEPRFRFWRPKHDIDIQTALNEADTQKFTKDILERLQSKGKANEYRIASYAPGAIEKNIKGTWQKITDIHSEKEIVPGSAEVSPTAREGAYGMMHSEKPVTINYPGIGKVNVMTASEMGKRKAQAILRWQEGKFAPYDYRVKDITDFYIIDRTFRGEEAANAWAKAYGFDPADLLKAAEKNPPTIVGWEFIPDASKVVKGSLPSITLNANQTIRSLASASTKASILSSLSKLSKKGIPSKVSGNAVSSGAKAKATGSTSGKAKASKPSPSTSAKPTSKTAAPSGSSASVPSKSAPAVSVPVSPPPSKASPTVEGSGVGGGSGGGSGGGGGTGGSGGGGSSGGGGDNKEGIGGQTKSPVGGSAELEIEHVEGIPKHPGIVVYDMGFSRVKVKPPYRPGPEDIDFEHLKSPTKGKGSEQATLRVYDGDAPQKLVLRHGWKRTSILQGEELHNTIIKSRGRGIVMGLDGRTRKSHKKGLLRSRRPRR